MEVTGRLECCIHLPHMFFVHVLLGSVCVSQCFLSYSVIVPPSLGQRFPVTRPTLIKSAEPIFFPSRRELELHPTCREGICLTGQVPEPNIYFNLTSTELHKHLN
jgi:hypothetical protein